MRKIPWKWNVPNVLSLVRIALVPVIAVTYLMSRDNPTYLYWAIGALVLSGLTDAADGFIARRFNQITDIGKLLDPIADKMTQITVALCLTVRYPKLIPLLIICVIKESCQAIGSAFLLNKGEKVRGASWYGKVATIIFYVAMCAVVLFNDRIPDAWMYAIVGVVAAAMIFAFVNYFRDFIRINRERKAALSENNDDKTRGE